MPLIMEAALPTRGRSLDASTMVAVDSRHRYRLERLSIKGWLAVCRCGYRCTADTKREVIELVHKHRALILAELRLGEINQLVFGSGHHLDRRGRSVSCKCGWVEIGGDNLARLEAAIAHGLMVEWSAEQRASALRPSSGAKVVSRSARRLRASQAKASTKSA